MVNLQVHGRQIIFDYRIASCEKCKHKLEVL